MKMTYDRIVERVWRTMWMRCVIGLVDSGSRIDWRKERESVRSK